jgi:DNA-binding XRE family transcriptional regulator
VTKTDLIEWRRRLSLTQEQAAGSIGCSKRSIVIWEQGARDVPKYIALACAAIALGVTEYPPKR